MLHRLSFYFYVFYCFEVGIFLLVVPWWLPQVWDQNYIFARIPFLAALSASGYFRGAISGLGIVNILVGVRELIEHERLRRAAEPGGK